MTSESLLDRTFSQNIQEFAASQECFLPTNLLAKDYVIFYHPTMEKLATNLLHSLTTRHNNLACCLGKITWKSFNDGFPDIFVHNIQDLVGRDIIFVASFNTPGDIFEQLSVCALFPSYRVRSLSFLLPYSPVATMERSSVPGEIVTAVTLAKMFGIIGCRTDLYLVDLHTYHNLHYFPDHIFPIFVHSAHKLKQILLQKSLPERELISIVFPDSGAFQRYRFVVPPFEYVICTKIRDGDERYITITQGQNKINNRDLFLIDDLIHSGGTIRETITALREQYQPRSISLFITHGIFEQETWKPFVDLYNQGIIKDFYLCDTTPMATKLNGIGPFKTISIADDLSDCLYHGKQPQYNELKELTSNSVNSSMNGNGINNANGSSIDRLSVTSPVENLYSCKDCTAQFHRHAKMLLSSQQYQQTHSIFHPQQLQPLSQQHQQLQPQQLTTIASEPTSSNISDLKLATPNTIQKEVEEEVKVDKH